MTTFYRLKENGKILDYTEFDLTIKTKTEVVTEIEYKEEIVQEKFCDENGDCVIQNVVKTIEVPVKKEVIVTVDHVPAFIREQYLETDRKIIKLTDGSFAFEDEVNLEEEAKRKAEKGFAEAKKAKLTEVDTWTANKITGGFVSNCYNGENILYDTDTETQLTMTKARTNCKSEKFTINFPKGMPCRGYQKFSQDENGNFIFDKNDKLIFLFTPEQIIAWDEDFSLHLAKCKGEGWEKQAQVNACATKEEIESIVLE